MSLVQQLPKRALTSTLTIITGRRDCSGGHNWETWERSGMFYGICMKCTTSASCEVPA